MELTSARITRQEYPEGVLSEPRIEVVYEHGDRTARQVFGVSSCARACGGSVHTEWLYQFMRAHRWASRELLGASDPAPPTVNEARPVFALIDGLMEAESNG